MKKSDTIIPSLKSRLKIYHNPRCKKSREGLAILENSGKEFEIIKYLENPLSEKELSSIIKVLNISPIELVRKNEKVWRDNFKNKKLTDKEIIAILQENPKLIERPIVVHNATAIIGKPPELIETIL